MVCVWLGSQEYENGVHRTITHSPLCRASILHGAIEYASVQETLGDTRVGGDLSNATVGVHSSCKILSVSGAPSNFRCTRLWVRASSFANLFGVSLAYWDSNPGVLLHI